jgi:hypothetical protein
MPLADLPGWLDPPSIEAIELPTFRRRSSLHRQLAVFFRPHLSPRLSHPREVLPDREQGALESRAAAIRGVSRYAR